MSMTERQEKWLASVKASLEAETGRSLAEWAEIARTCPEAGHRATLKWFKEVHGLGQNRASIILAEITQTGAGRDDPDALLDRLWTDPAGRAVYEAVAERVRRLPDVVVAPRKSFVGFSRQVQFAAIKPVKGGALLGVALAPQEDPRLQAPRRESWSDRLKSALPLSTPAEVDASLDLLLRKAWDQAG